MNAVGCRRDHRIAPGIERDGGDRIPVSGVPGRAPKIGVSLSTSRKSVEKLQSSFRQKPSLSELSACMASTSK